MEHRSIEERLDAIEKTLDMSRDGYANGFGYEYKSSMTIMGLPLIHVATGVDKDTGRVLIARGIIAIGQIAFGLIAIGGIAVGLLTLGGLSLALLVALGGFAAGGYVAAGGFAIAGFLALGGFAISWNYAIGGMAIGPHPLGANYQDPEVLEFLSRFFPDWKI